MLRIALKVLDPRAKEHLPKTATAGSAGVDLKALLDSPLTVNPGETTLVHTGLAVHIADPGYAALILPRSGLGHSTASCSAISSVSLTLITRANS